MIDPARFVAADLSVDDILPVVQAEEECARVVVVLGHALPRNAFAGVFDDSRAFSDCARGVDTATMGARFEHFNGR